MMSNAIKSIFNVFKYCRLSENKHNPINTKDMPRKIEDFKEQLFHNFICNLIVYSGTSACNVKVIY